MILLLIIYQWVLTLSFKFATSINHGKNGWLEIIMIYITPMLFGSLSHKLVQKYLYFRNEVFF